MVDRQSALRALEKTVGGSDVLLDIDKAVLDYILAALTDASVPEDDAVEALGPFLPELSTDIASTAAAAAARDLRRALHGIPDGEHLMEKPVRLAKVSRLGAGIGFDAARRSASSRHPSAGNANATLDRTDEAALSKEAAEKRRARRTGHQPKSYVSQATVASVKANYTPGTLDIRMEGVDLAFGGLNLLEGATLNVPYGRRVGLVGRNGLGKTTLMRAMARRELPIPDSMDIVYVEQEQIGSDKTPLECVLESDTVRQQLLQEEQELTTLMSSDDNKDDAALSTRLAEIYKTLADVDADKAEGRAASILDGLGFSSHQMKAMSTKEFSGGWRMRIAIASALFIAPKLLLLDEPTNHLDMSSVLWLGNYLLHWPHTVVLVSHDREFLNTVCSDILYVRDKKLHAYSGSYDDFERVRNERQKELERASESYEMKKAHVQKFIDKFRYNAKRAQMAQSRIKLLQRMEEERVVMPGEEEEFSFSFPDPGALTGSHGALQLCDVSFKYPGAQSEVFSGLDFNVNIESRMCLLGPNGGKFIDSRRFCSRSVVRRTCTVSRKCALWACSLAGFSTLSLPRLTDSECFRCRFVLACLHRAVLVRFEPILLSLCIVCAMYLILWAAGKSTLMKLLVGEHLPTEGEVRRSQKIRLGYFSQHHVEQLVLWRTPLEHMKVQFPEATMPDLRGHLAKLGVKNDQALRPINTLSGGQKSRVALAVITYQRPHILMLDEVSNHLDIESIDAIIAALNSFSGGILLITHDARLISAVCDEIWVCDKGTVKKYPGNFREYRQLMIKQLNERSQLVGRH